MKFPWRVLVAVLLLLATAAAWAQEGEGLGSAENPLDPQIGDLRVSWRELILPPLAGKVVLRADVWQLADDSSGGVLPEPAAAALEPASDHLPRAWPFLALGLVLIVAIVVAMRRRRQRR